MGGKQCIHFANIDVYLLCGLFEALYFMLYKDLSQISWIL